MSCRGVERLGGVAALLGCEDVRSLARCRVRGGSGGNAPMTPVSSSTLRLARRRVPSCGCTGNEREHQYGVRMVRANLVSPSEACRISFSSVPTLLSSHRCAISPFRTLAPASSRSSSPAMYPARPSTQSQQPHARRVGSKLTRFLVSLRAFLSCRPHQMQGQLFVPVHTLERARKRTLELRINSITRLS